MPQPEPTAPDLIVPDLHPQAPRPDIVLPQPKGVAYAADAPPLSIAPDPPMIANPAQTDLATILSQARAAHAEYRQNAPRITNGQTVENRPAALAALERALERRETADALDDDHSDPAWVDDLALGYRQRDLLTYYRQVKERYLK